MERRELIRSRLKTPSSHFQVSLDVITASDLAAGDCRRDVPSLSFPCSFPVDMFQSVLPLIGASLT